MNFFFKFFFGFFRPKRVQKLILRQIVSGGGGEVRFYHGGGGGKGPRRGPRMAPEGGSGTDPVRTWGVPGRLSMIVLGCLNTF